MSFLDLPEPPLALMSSNGHTKVTIKFFNKDSESYSYEVRKVYLLGFVDESHSDFYFVYTNMWTKHDPMRNSIIARKHKPSLEKGFAKWTPPCWVVRPEENDGRNLRIESVGWSKRYGKRFQEKQRLYNKLMKSFTKEIQGFLAL